MHLQHHELQGFNKHEHTRISTAADDDDDAQYFQNDGWNDHPQLQQGIHFRIPDPRHYGTCHPFFYIDGEPLCLVGPDCNPRKVNFRAFFFRTHRHRGRCLQIRSVDVHQAFLSDTFLHSLYRSSISILRRIRYAGSQESWSEESTERSEIRG